MRSLIAEFQRFNLCPLQKYAKLISSKSKKDDRLFPPYIPLIGKNYEKFKILIYATAQNMAYNDVVAKRYSDHFNKLVERLYYSENFARKYPHDYLSYKDVDIAPYNQGVLPALAGIFIYTVCHEVLTNFDSIQDHIAVSNYYKFSLHGKRDINPNHMDRWTDANDYWDLNDELVSCELDLLRPNYVLAFHGRHEGLLKNLAREKDFKLNIINDPAWILRGAWGYLKPQGSWGSKTSEIRDNKLLGIIGGYLENLKSSDDYKNSYQAKKKAVKVYLLKYHLDWRNQM